MVILSVQEKSENLVNESLDEVQALIFLLLVDTVMTVMAFSSSTIRIPSHLNMMTAPFLWADLEERLLPSATVVLDMSKTKSVDNNGIHILNKAVEISKSVNAQIQFVGLSKSIEIRLIVGGVLRSI